MISGRLRDKQRVCIRHLTGNPRRRIPYPDPAYGRKRVDTEPVKPAGTAPWVNASFTGGSTEGSQPFVRVKGQCPLAWYRAAAPGRCGEAASLSSGVQRWKTLAQGKLMSASACTGYYLTQTFAGFAASPPFPVPGTSSEEGGKSFETDTAQRTLRQAWRLQSPPQ